jgi:hypothetical protein
MFDHAIKLRCEECEVPFVQWGYAPRIPNAGELIIIGGYEYTVIAVKLRLLSDEEKQDPSNDRVVAATCLIRPTREDEGF